MPRFTSSMPRWRSSASAWATWPAGPPRRTRPRSPASGAHPRSGEGLVTHDAGHVLLEAAAAAILVVGGAACLILAWHARHLGGSVTLLPEPPDSVARAVRVLAAVLSLGAAVIHFAATPAHLEELGLAGLGFVAAGTFQAAWTLAWLIEASPVVGRIGIAGNLGIVAIWGWSRTIGLPV